MLLLLLFCAPPLPLFFFLLILWCSLVVLWSSRAMLWLRKLPVFQLFASSWPIYHFLVLAHDALLAVHAMLAFLLLLACSTLIMLCCACLWLDIPCCSCLWACYAYWFIMLSCLGVLVLHLWHLCVCQRCLWYDSALLMQANDPLDHFLLVG
jgi:hypothetical protein